MKHKPARNGTHGRITVIGQSCDALLRVQSLILGESQQVVRLYKKLQAVQADFLYHGCAKL